MKTTIKKSKILNLRPINVDKSDGGQYNALRRIFSRMDKPGYVCFGRKDESGHMTQEFFEANVLRNSIGSGNLHVSGQNVYFCPSLLQTSENRQKVNVGYLTCCFVDLDYQKIPEHKNRTPDEMSAKVMEHCKKYKMPLPTMIVSTGHGLHVYWVFQEMVEASYLFVWDEVQSQIINEFKNFGADNAAKDAVRFLRVPGTVNAKDRDNVEPVYITYESPRMNYVKWTAMYNWAKRRHRAIWVATVRKYIPGISPDTPLYKLDQWIDSGKVCPPGNFEYKPFIENVPSDAVKAYEYKEERRRVMKRNETPEQMSARFSEIGLTVNVMRVKDLETLVTVRHGEMTGCREFFLFYYRDALGRVGYSKKVQLEKVREMNAKFTEPLPDDEVLTVARQRLYYLARSETIIKNLHITEEEQMFMETICTKEEKTRRKIAKNKHGMSNDERVKRNCDIILQCLTLGMSCNEIAEKVGITARSVRNYIHKYDLKNKGVMTCAKQITEKEIVEHELSNATKKTAKEFAKKAVDSLKEKANVPVKDKTFRMTKKQKEELVARLLLVLKSHVINIAEKMALVAYDFFKELGITLLARKDPRKILTQPPVQTVLLRLIPGFKGNSEQNSMATRFFETAWLVLPNTPPVPCSQAIPESFLPLRGYRAPWGQFFHAQCGAGVDRPDCLKTQKAVFAFSLRYMYLVINEESSIE